MEHFETSITRFVLSFFLVLKVKKFNIFFNPIPVGLFLSNIGWGVVDSTPPPLVSQGIMRKQCCNSYVIWPTF